MNSRNIMTVLLLYIKSNISVNAFFTGRNITRANLVYTIVTAWGKTQICSSKDGKGHAVTIVFALAKRKDPCWQESFRFACIVTL